MNLLRTWRLSTLQGEFGKCAKSDQNIMMNEKFVNKNVMNGEIVQNIVINAKIDPKVAMDLYMFKNWWLEPFTAQEPKIIGSIY